MNCYEVQVGGNNAASRRTQGLLMAHNKGHDLEVLLEQKADIEQKLASLERQIYH